MGRNKSTHLRLYLFVVVRRNAVQIICLMGISGGADFFESRVLASFTRRPRWCSEY
jgi:hypothetical protein